MTKLSLREVVETDCQRFIREKREALRLRVAGWVLDIERDPMGALESSSAYPRLCDVLAEQQVLKLVDRANPKTWADAIAAAEDTERLIREGMGAGDTRSKEMLDALIRWTGSWKYRFTKQWGAGLKEVEA